MSCGSTLRARRNADFQRVYQFYFQGIVLPLTGYGATFNVYTAPGTSPILTVMTTPSGNGSAITFTDASGYFEVYIAKADVAALPTNPTSSLPNQLFYDLLLENADDVTGCLVAGSFIVYPSGYGNECDDQEQIDFDLGLSSIQIQVYSGLSYIDAQNAVTSISDAEALLAEVQALVLSIGGAGALAGKMNVDLSNLETSSVESSTWNAIGANLLSTSSLPGVLTE